MSSVRLADRIMACRRKLTFYSDLEEFSDDSNVDPDYLQQEDELISTEDELQVSVGWHYIDPKKVILCCGLG